MSKVIRASFSLTDVIMDLLKEVSEFEMRTMSAELRFLVKQRALQIINMEECSDQTKQKLMRMLNEADKS